MRCKEGMESKRLKVDVEKTNVMINGPGEGPVVRSCVQYNIRRVSV